MNEQRLEREHASACRCAAFDSLRLQCCSRLGLDHQMPRGTAPHVSDVTMKFTRYQLFVIALLAFVQFTMVLDFMILSPLGALLMPKLSISPSQFGTVVSAYAFSAGISGILAAGFE